MDPQAYHKRDRQFGKWNGKLVQRSLHSLLNDGCLARLTDRYDLTTQACDPQILCVLEEL